jgi:hypothetical protein
MSDFKSPLKEEKKKPKRLFSYGGGGSAFAQAMR